MGLGANVGRTLPVVASNAKTFLRGMGVEVLKFATWLN